MLKYANPALIDFALGDATNLQIPAHGEALRTAGPGFLTAAFHRFGSLSPHNHVVRINRLESFHGGNSGHKVFLSVEYALAEPNLHTDLFVKFSRDFRDAFRDRRKHELEAEVRLATLSRVPNFPTPVPTAYFADFNRESGTGLLITQRIAFGHGNIEPLHPKCMDHELDDPLAYYRSIVSTLARLAAAHKSGLLSPHVDELFPFDAGAAIADDPIPWNDEQLNELITSYSAFAANHSRLLPANITTPQFIAKLQSDAKRFLRHETTIKRFLHANRNLIALCHYNGNIDNAWFWRDAGTLHCGLLDWGRVRQMNVAYALWGSLCAAGFDIWDRHFDELLSLFINELHLHGGPLLDVAELKLHLHMYAATMGIAVLMQAPTLVQSRLPEAINAESPLDTIMHKNEMVRSFLHVFSVFLYVWQTQDFGASLDRVLQSVLGDDT